MIFVTVGTHEQPFNRIIKEIDDLKGNGVIQEDVFMQIGYSTYLPKNCLYSKMISYDEMISKIKCARIVITHGGPASFLLALQEHKIPIVVPRQKKFNEHINDHQVEFVKFLYERQKKILPIFEIKDLEKTINHYDKLIESIDKDIVNHNETFNIEFESIINELMKK
jgi:UDP-N-acetylglucosamine transferase subunit ALG13